MRRMIHTESVSKIYQILFDWLDDDPTCSEHEVTLAISERLNIPYETVSMYVNPEFN